MRKNSNGSERGVRTAGGGAPKADRPPPHPPLAPDRAGGSSAAGLASGTRPKSLMKTSDLATHGKSARQFTAPPRSPAAAAKGRRTFASGDDRNRKIEERIGAASQELASGISQAVSAGEELRRAMEQILSGAEEAAAAAQETLAVSNTTAATLAQARGRAETSRKRTEAVQSLIAESSNQIAVWAANVKLNGERQAGSVAIMEKLTSKLSASET